jgi:type VI secretion system protein ImpC
MAVSEGRADGWGSSADSEQAPPSTGPGGGSIEERVRRAIAVVDARLSAQLAEIMHADRFLRLEAAWRGLRYLVTADESGPARKIRVLNITKQELGIDFANAKAFDQSVLFKRFYEYEFEVPGGEPYAALVGDYEFSHCPEDLGLLRQIADVAAFAFAPFLSAASPDLFGMSDFLRLEEERDLSAMFAHTEYAAWRAFRASDASRFLCLTMPRTLARTLYNGSVDPAGQFRFDEAGFGAASHEHCCWMNSAYVLAARLSNAFCQSGWYAPIPGVGTGKIEDLPRWVLAADAQDEEIIGPTEAGIGEPCQVELGTLGLLPLCRVGNGGDAVFMAAQTLHHPTAPSLEAVTADATIAASLPYVMATSRFAHYLKIMVGQLLIGASMDKSDYERWLNNWISAYVAKGGDAGADTTTPVPLRAARISVTDVPGPPGAVRANAWMWPRLQPDELSKPLKTFVPLKPPG